MATQQKFKAIYFPDYKTDNPNAKGLVLAFGEKDATLYKNIASLNSHGVRELLNTHSFIELERDANTEGLSLNTYCLWRLRKQEKLDFAKKDDGTIDPIYTTFRGGKRNPLHNWYSFLEGYSPEFVEHILDNFTHDATTIYDPFAGTGVTPIVSSQRGLVSLYSEINPLLQFLVKTKIDISLTPERQRKKILANLNSVKENFSKLLRESLLDSDLSKSHKASFGASKFFDDQTFHLVLKARTLIDEISYTNLLTSNLLQVAILNSLIPSSLLKRAGDVRYKTQKELKQKTDFIEEITKNLANIIRDIESIEGLPTRPILLTEDAKVVDSLPATTIDAIITSPPYLNGTNYFRNTKVELWFLRSIKTQRDLSEFRKTAVTAGINDVSQKRPSKFVTKEVERVVSKLSESAYDQRIPKMVTYYFQDMCQVFENLKSHLSSRATIAIDIGDSVYGGVKVPTDELLVGTLKKIGYDFEQSITLRKRMSRSGEILKQVLLIFRAPIREIIKKAERGQNLIQLQEWNAFKENLPHQEKPFSKRNWGHPLHSLCSYQGKLKPSLAYFLVKTFTKSGQRLLDPFAGVGTIPFEAALNGVKSFGFDISPAALHIATAKLGRSDQKDINNVIEKLEDFIKNSQLAKEVLETASHFGLNKKLRDYYHKKTLEEIVKSREFFKQNTPNTSAEDLVFASLLHILHGNRPYALSRRSHGITPFAPSGEFEYRSLITRLREKVQRSLAVELPNDFMPGEILYQDATLWWPRNIKDLDAIITSPPFFDSTRFYLANWLRLWFSGWNNEDFQKRPLGFVDEKQKTGFDVYEPILRQSRERLKPSGVLVFHLGRSKKCDMAAKLQEIAKPWFRVVDVFEESVEDGESHGIKDKGTVNKHQFLILN